jgi:hypothetical protein
MNSDPQEQMRQAARDVSAELSRVIDQIGKLARQAGDDLKGLVGDPARGVTRFRPKSEAGPADMIREIGRLRDEGLITEEEFQAKKAELLSRV